VLISDILTALKKSDGDIMVLFSSDLGNILWAMLIISMLIPTAFDYWRKRRPAEQS
jgi:putative tricarboxylic transport membrane protein